MPVRKSHRLLVAVYDHRGTPVVDAKVSLRPATGKASEAVPLVFDKKLRMHGARGVLPGSYRLKAVAAGFESQERRVVMGHADQRQTFVLGKPGMPFFYRGVVRVPFEPQPNLLAAALKPGAAQKGEQELRVYAASLKLKPEAVGEKILRSDVRVFRLPGGMSEEVRLKVQALLAEHPVVEQVGPIVHLDAEALSFLTETVIVKFRSAVAKEDIYAFAKRFNATVVRHIPYAGNTFEMRHEGPATMKLLTICEEMVKSDLVEYAEPDLYSTVVEDQIHPTDYLYPEQWHHALIRTPDAWQLLANLSPNDTFGSPNIIIADVDSGVDVANQDFSGNVTSGVVKVYQLFDFANMVANNNNRDGDHGTGTAGAVTGQASNPSVMPGQNEGMAGVAGNCRLMGIRRFGPESRYSDAYIWMSGFDPNSALAGFPLPISPGADVITNSFGYSVGVPISGLMSDTFDYLTTYGRGGKGVLLFFSVGNYAAPQDFTLLRPWAAYEKTFAISASTLANDGVTEVFSNYSGFGGAGVVDLCAPSQDTYVGPLSLHNPPQTYGAMSCDEVGHGNMPGHPAMQTTLSAAANANSFTTLTAGTAVGATTLNVTSSAGFAVGQWIRVGQHGVATAEWVQITAVPGAAQLTVAACTSTHSSGSPVLGESTISVTSNAGFVAGQWLLLGQPGQANTEACLIRQIPAGGTQIGIAGPLQNHAINTAVITGPNDYRNSFGGTSFSTPVVAGVAALVLSANPELNWTTVRHILRTTANRIDAANIDPVGQYVDNDGDGVAEYSRWYGFGRVDAAAAVQEAINLVGATPATSIDTWIMENSGDVGDVPCPPPYSPDVWVRNVDPAVDNPAQVTIHQEPIRNQDNWVYVNVRNRGAVDSHDVYVRILITRWAGTQYLYPDDFIPTNPPGSNPTVPLAPGTYLIDEIHIDSIPAGGVVTANALWAAALIPPASVTIDGVTYSWADACLLVDVSPHDGPTPTGSNTWDNNNLAQKNVFPVDPTDADDQLIGFVAGHRRNAAGLLQLRIVRRGLPPEVKLYFDYVDRDTAKRAEALLARARVATKNELATCEVTFVSESDVLLQCPDDETPIKAVIAPQTTLTIPYCPAGTRRATYDLRRVGRERPTVFALPAAQTAYVPLPRAKGQYQVVALRMTGLKRLKRGHYQVDIYQETIDGRLEGGINFIIGKKKQ